MTVKGTSRKGHRRPVVTCWPVADECPQKPQICPRPHDDSRGKARCLLDSAEPLGLLGGDMRLRRCRHVKRHHCQR